MTSTTNSISKLAAIVAGSALVAMSFAAAIPAAHAQTTTTTTTTSQTASLEAQIASLQAQLAASQGGTSASVTFTRDLTVGSTGSDVTALQTWLIAKGFSIPAGATGYFGAQTKAAVAAYQAANGISPAVGYFGPITRAKVNATAGTTTTTTTTTSTAGCVAGAAFSSTTGQACTTTTSTGGSTSLTGGEGSVNNFQTIGASTTILGQGANQNVYGFSFMAGGSDLNVDRINYSVVLSSDNTQATASIHPWNVFQTATLTDSSGNTIATVDATNQNNWSQEGTGGYQGDTQVYQITFSGLNQVVKEGATQTYYLKLSTQSVISSANANAKYAVMLESQGLRATDALGLQEYSPNLTGNGNDVQVENTVAGTATISTGSDNPVTTTIMGNTTNPTNNIVLNTFTIAANGGENVELYSLPVTASTTGVSGTLVTPGALIQSLSLYQGSTLLDTVSPAATSSAQESVNFNNLNLNIPQGTTDSFSIQANISPIDGVTIPNGSAVVVSVPNGVVAGVGTVTPNIEDSSGNNVGVTGASTGNVISFASTGVSVSAPTTNATVAINGGNVTSQTGTFTFTFNVTAFGQTIYVGTTSAAYDVTIHDQGSNGPASTTSSAITSNATRSQNGNFMISNGQTQSFTVTAIASNGGKDFYYATLNSLKYSTLDSATGATASSTPLPSTFTTASVSISS
jgi:peptidoglycan hydrolase-like protein with peptidoglycan-binding domain